MVKMFFNYCQIASIIIGFVFVLSMLYSKKAKDKSIIFLSLVVFFLTLNNLQIVLIDNIYREANPFFHKLLIPFYALILPSFYTFLTYYLNLEKKISSFVLFTSSLFILELAARVILFILFYGEDYHHVVAKYAQLEEIVNALFSLFLYIKAFLLVFNPKVNDSKSLLFDHLKWLKTFLFLGSIILLTWICAIVLNLDKVINPEIFIYYPLRLSSSVLVFWIGYQGFFNYSIMIERRALRNNITVTTEKSSPKTTPKKEGDNKFLLVNDYVVKNNRYLDQNFSLDNLASELKMSVSTLSQVINQKSGHNFTDYINELRVERAKMYLVNPEFSNYTIVAIGLECGFNSKSTFYTAFKKFTKITPSEFKQLNPIL